MRLKQISYDSAILWVRPKNLKAFPNLISLTVDNFHRGTGFFEASAKNEDVRIPSPDPNETPHCRDPKP